MKVLLTGASSFTGYWFAKSLIDQQYEVVATFSSQPLDYQGIRARRVEQVAATCTPVFGCVFGSPQFAELLGDGVDVLCHHAADVTDYQSPDFDVVNALKSNTLNIRNTLAHLAENGCQRLVITGSVFEPGEGRGSDGLQAFSPYGLSKALTAQVIAYYARQVHLKTTKFVIPNPFGPFEESRFTAYLVNKWLNEEVAGVRTPNYIRDNIHVDLLAQVYANTVATAPDDLYAQVNPSGYVESQGAFAQRFAQEIGGRLGLQCRLELADQTEFTEPLERANTEPAAEMVEGWQESQAWDRIADYYASTNAQTT